MRVRRAFFNWLFPAAVVLPLWLFIGWGVFNAGGLAFLWVLFIAVPSVFLGQLAIALLTRSRPSVRAARALAWSDVAAIGVWHVLTIVLGFYAAVWWTPVMILTVIVGVALLAWQARRLWGEVRPSDIILHTHNGAGYIPAPDERTRTDPRTPAHDVIVVEERAHPER